MWVRTRARLLGLIFLGSSLAGYGQESLPGTQPLTLEGDLSAQMVAGLDQFLQWETEQALKTRPRLWHRDFSSVQAYEKSIQPNREHLRQMLGVVDPRLPAKTLQAPTNPAAPVKLGENEAFRVLAVRWPVFDGVFGEGLWLLPKGTPQARVVALPEADQTPEMLVGLASGLAPERQYARRLAEQGCEVLVPVLIDRQDTWSANPLINRFTNQPHREWIYRQAFELGRHIIGYEVQKVLAAVDWFALENVGNPAPLPLGVAGYGEGGLIAFYAAALDSRIQAALVSGYFNSRQQLWQEPIYRNVFGLLQEFGDAEIASLIAPRSLIVEYSPVPAVSGPPQPREGHSGAAPGRLGTPDYESVEAEFDRARDLVKPGDNLERFTLISGPEGMLTGPGSDRALEALLYELGVKVKEVKQPGNPVTVSGAPADAAERQRRQVKQLEAFTQSIYAQSEAQRAEFFWHRIETASPQEWEKACQPFRKQLWEETLGRLPSPSLPANPRTRKVADQPKWTGHEVVLDLYPRVFAWGLLLVPKDLKAGERRPVVVCQHGLEGVPMDLLNEVPSSQAYRYYKAFAARLAEQGFIVFAPHNPYRGGDSFRQLQRKANPLKQSLFSLILAQHERILEWLSEQPFVDARRIGFYGLSYGGKTAMRVPAVLEGYALSICSGDFNDWVRKNVSLEFPASYMFSGEYEMPEWNLGATFNYAEMAALIAPRPFMVERGRQDGVGLDEWVAAEYAKVSRQYKALGIPDRTAIEFFDGPHTINGLGSFQFLRQHLQWGQADPQTPKSQTNPAPPM